MKKVTKRKIITLVLIIVYIIFSIISSIVFKTKGESLLESLYYSTQILASIYIIAGVIIAVWQYYNTTRTNMANMEITQIQRAIDMSEYYKDNILYKYPPIRDIFSTAGIQDIFDRCLGGHEFKSFDNAELSKFISESDRNKIEEKWNSAEFILAIIEADTIYNLDLKTESFEDELNNVLEKIKNGETIEKGDKNGKKLAYDLSGIVSRFMVNYITETLNAMEFFAMHFNHNTADESVVYQSLHSSYIQIVECFYYVIARQNSDAAKRYYTNVIWLYGVWKTRAQEQELARQTSVVKIENHGNKVSKIV